MADTSEWMREAAERIFSHAIDWNEGRKSWDMDCVANIIAQCVPQSAWVSVEQPVLKRGQMVHVEHPRFVGKGMVMCDAGRHTRMVSVTLENGNTWEYERETVTALPTPPASEEE